MARPARTASHLHGCPGCRDTFVCVCAAPQQDPRCNACVSGIPSLLAQGRRPATCCFSRARPARGEEIRLYRLAGSRPWWICRDCKRTFVYQPGAPGG